MGSDVLKSWQRFLVAITRQYEYKKCAPSAAMGFRYQENMPPELVRLKCTWETNHELLYVKAIDSNRDLWY